MKNISYGLRGHDIADSFDDMCRTAKEYGIKNLQFALAKTVNNIDFDKTGYDKEVSLKIKTELDKYGLKIAVLGCYINPAEQNTHSLGIQLKRFESFIDYAYDFNAGVIGTETGYGSIEYLHSDDNYRFFLNNMEPVMRKAEDKGVFIGIEPVWTSTIYSPQRMKQMLDDMKSDNLRVILDISNLMSADNYKNQKQIIDDAFELFGSRISTVHLKDFDFKDGKKIFELPCRGLLEIKYLLYKISMLDKTPDIILDELPVKCYKQACEELNML